MKKGIKIHKNEWIIGVGGVGKRGVGSGLQE